MAVGGDVLRGTGAVGIRRVSQERAAAGELERGTARSRAAGIGAAGGAELRSGSQHVELTHREGAGRRIQQRVGGSRS